MTTAPKRMGGGGPPKDAVTTAPTNTCVCAATSAVAPACVHRREVQALANSSRRKRVAVAMGDEHMKVWKIRAKFQKKKRSKEEKLARRRQLQEDYSCLHVFCI